MDKHRAGRLEGKVALIGGAGTSAPGMSIGKATSIHFAREGAKIFAVDVSIEAATEVCELIREEGYEAVPFQADLSHQDDIENMVTACVDTFGRIDILDHNAGIGEPAGPIELPVEDWDRVFALNCRGLFLACKAVLPHMVGQRSGSIVAISSVAGLRYPGFPHMAYGVSKAALTHLVRYVALQYARDNVRANAVAPGLVDTPRIARLSSTWTGEEDDDAKRAFDAARRARDEMCPMGHTASPWDIAFAAAFLASEEARYITGTELVVDGGASVALLGRS